MNENIKKYPNNNIKTEEKNKEQINIIEKRPNHIILESKYEKPSSKKIFEQKFENTQEISSRNKFGNLPIISGKNNPVKSNVCNNEKQKEKDIRQNKENIKRRIQNKKTEKEQQEGIKFGQGIDKSTPK